MRAGSRAAVGLLRSYRFLPGVEFGQARSRRLISSDSTDSLGQGNTFPSSCTFGWPGLAWAGQSGNLPPRAGRLRMHSGSRESMQSVSLQKHYCSNRLWVINSRFLHTPFIQLPSLLHFYWSFPSSHFIWIHSALTISLLTQ